MQQVAERLGELRPDPANPCDGLVAPRPAAHRRGKSEWTTGSGPVVTKRKGRAPVVTKGRQAPVVTKGGGSNAVARSARRVARTGFHSVPSLPGLTRQSMRPLGRAWVRPCIAAARRNGPPGQARW